MGGRSRMWVVAVLVAGLPAVRACKAAPPKTSARGGEATMTQCFEGVDMNLGIPDDAVFFLAEVGDGHEPQAHKRWAVTVEGKVMFSANDEPFDFSQLPKEPFNRPFQARPIAEVPAAEWEAFLAWLEARGVFELPSELGPPPDLIVKGGADLWMVVRWKGRTACVRLRPGAPLADLVDERFSDLVSPHIRRDAP